MPEHEPVTEMVYKETEKEQVTGVACENCHGEIVLKNKNARFCSDDCRMNGIRNRKKSDFYVAVDEFERQGVIEWVNPESAI